MNFKSLFIKEDVTAAINKPAVTAGVYQNPKPTTNPPIKKAVKQPTFDPEIREALLASIQENKMGGFDYLKLTSALEEAKELADDESKQYKIAVLSAKQTGVDKTKLISSAEHYLNVLENDSKEFAKELQKQQKATIGASETRLSTLEQQIADAKATIQNLTNEINAAQAEHEELSTKIQEDTTKLEERRLAFQTTFEQLTEEIKSNIEKINKYL